MQKRTNSLLPILKSRLKIEKSKGSQPIQQIDRYSNSWLILGLSKKMGRYIDFQSIHKKWTIDALLQHMGFYATTENPCVMMGEDHNTQSFAYVFIYEDELYIVSTTAEQILHMLKDKYKINICLQDKYPHDPGGRDICQLKQYLEKLYQNVNILFNDKLPTDLHIAFEIIKLLIKKGNLNLIHNKNTYIPFNYLSRKRKLDKLYNEV